jgi:very-short-patch-repair endonuclease
MKQEIWLKGKKLLIDTKYFKKERKQTIENEKKRKKFLFNKDKGKKYSKKLKYKKTVPESILKTALEKEGIIFEFQKPFFSINKCYIVDFYFENILGKKYIIEIDGKQHYTKKGRAYDKIRSFFLYHNCKCCVVRFKNEEVLKNLDSVLDKICSFNPKCIDGLQG